MTWIFSPPVFVGVPLLLVFLALTHGASDLSTPMGMGLLAAMAAAGATALGAFPSVFVRRLSPRLEDVLLAFGGGVMAAASCFSLILPGVAAASDLFGIKMLGALWVACGIALGAVFLLFSDRFVPHEHPALGHHGPDIKAIRRVWLIVFAIILHNFPEGMAIGVGFAQGDLSVGVPLASAIAIQDIPEGLIVALSLRTIGISAGRAALIGAASGLAEPLGAIVGVLLTAGLAPLYPLGLGFAAGAMLWVVSHEIIPETHRKGHENAATLGLLGGFMVMMMLDTALG